MIPQKKDGAFPPPKDGKAYRVLLVGGTRYHSNDIFDLYTDKLKAYNAVVSFHRPTGSHQFGSPISPTIDFVLVLTDFLGTIERKLAQAAGDKAGVPVFVTRRQWAQIQQELEAHGLKRLSKEQLEPPTPKAPAANPLAEPAVPAEDVVSAAPVSTPVREGESPLPALPPPRPSDDEVVLDLLVEGRAETPSLLVQEFRRRTGRTHATLSETFSVIRKLVETGLFKAADLPEYIVNAFLPKEDAPVTARKVSAATPLTRPTPPAPPSPPSLMEVRRANGWKAEYLPVLKEMLEKFSLGEDAAQSDADRFLHAFRERVGAAVTTGALRLQINFLLGNKLMRTQVASATRLRNLFGKLDKEKRRQKVQQREQKVQLAQASSPAPAEGAGTKADKISRAAKTNSQRWMTERNKLRTIDGKRWSSSTTVAQLAGCSRGWIELLHKMHKLSRVRQEPEAGGPAFFLYPVDEGLAQVAAHRSHSSGPPTKTKTSKESKAEAKVLKVQKSVAQKCTACLATLAPAARFCSSCGKKAASSCTGCGAALDAVARFCSACGTQAP